MVCLYLCMCVCVFTQVEAVNGVSVPVCVYTSGSSKWCVCTCVCVFTQVEAVNGVSVPVCLHKWKQ